jgi:hypothetical protein
MARRSSWRPWQQTAPPHPNCALAARISAEQTPQIERLRAWPRERLLAEADPTHDHATMPGRQTDTDTAELANEMAVEQGSEIRRMEQIRVG